MRQKEKALKLANFKAFQCIILVCTITSVSIAYQKRKWNREIFDYRLTTGL